MCYIVMQRVRDEGDEMSESQHVTMREAASLLGVSHAKMWRLVRDGVLASQRNPLDRRQKVIRRTDIERLKSAGEATKRPQLQIIGIADLGVQSEDVEEWLEANWRPC
jgi:DNA-binding MarR family transcriptional regulator